MGPIDVREAVLRMLEDPSLMRDEGDLRDPVDPDEISEFEARSALVLPTAVRDWLSRHNGGLIGTQIACSLGAGAWEIEDLLRLEPAWKERGWIPVGADGSGDYYLAASRSSREDEGVVFFVDQMDFEVPAYAVGSDVWHFLYGLACEELLAKEWWPFELDGMLEANPTLANVTAVPLPWDVADQP